MAEITKLCDKLDGMKLKYNPTEHENISDVPFTCDAARNGNDTYQECELKISSNNGGTTELRVCKSDLKHFRWVFCFGQKPHVRD